MMIEAVIAGILSFIGTNIDDIFIDTLLFAQADTKRQVQAIVIGKYIGIGMLVLLSFWGACFLQTIPEKYIGFLGLIPIAFGLKEWMEDRKPEIDSAGNEERPDISKGLLFRVSLLTIANGADNIGVYIPLFAGYDLGQMTIVIVIFALMIALWCFMGKKLSDLPVLRNLLIKNRHIIVPVVFISLGIYILIKGC